MPWLLALYLVMVFWVPFDSTQLPIHLPVDSDLDRFVIGTIGVVWLVLAVRKPREIIFCKAAVNVAIFAFVTCAILSFAANLHQLTWNGEMELSIKQFSLVLSYLSAYLFAATSIRREEVRAFSKLLVILAVGTALGTIYEYKTGTDPFFTLASHLLVGAKVSSPASALATISGAGARPSVSGPALNGLADATLMSLAIPFAVCLAAVTTRPSRVLWIAAVVVLLVGCFATGRRSALLVPAVGLIVLCAYRPRVYARYLLIPVLAVGVLLIAIPSDLHSLISAIDGSSTSTSTAGRVADYAAVVPDIVSHLLIGRGYGSFDPLKYRILDDQILGLLITVGVFGTGSYVLIMLSTVVTVHGVARRGTSVDDHLMRAVAATALAYLLTNFLYDTLSFRQGPYLFFFIAALGATYCARSPPIVGQMPSSPPLVAAPHAAEAG